jgi:hypothetical protein
MGLDLVVEGCAKPGHEGEWRRLLERAFADKDLSEAEQERFQAISIPGYERIGAPRVGQDPAADQWIFEAQEAKTAEEKAAVLKEFEGYHVVRLVKCDGIPRYTHAGLYDGVDETSFRGKFLDQCRDVLSKKLRDDAYNHRFPDQAVAYGKALLVAADEAEAGRGPKPEQRQRGFLSRLFSIPEPEPMTVAEQLNVVRTAGRWFIFWGERGHPIRAWV